MAVKILEFVLATNVIKVVKLKTVIGIPAGVSDISLEHMLLQTLSQDLATTEITQVTRVTMSNQEGRVLFSSILQGIDISLDSRSNVFEIGYFSNTIFTVVIFKI